jgi:hypothetical protein
MDGGGPSIHFDVVKDDSRCPRGMTCVWAGNGEVQLTLSSAAVAPRTLVLNTNLDPKSAAYGGYTVALQALEPYPASTTPIRPGDYVATLLVTRP